MLKLLTRTGWILIAVGAFLMLSTISPLGLLLMLAGSPLVFIGVTVKTLKQHVPPGPGADG